MRDASSDAACTPALQLSFSFADCKQCTTGTLYATRQAAIQHVQSKHYRSRDERAKSKALDDQLLARWVRDDNQYRHDQRLELYANYIDIAHEHVRKAGHSAGLLREGVVQSDKASSHRYKLPMALLKALEHVVMLMMYAAVAFHLVDSYCTRLEQLANKDKQTHHRLLLEDARDNLDVTGGATLLLMAKAEQDLMLMAHTDYDEGIVSYEAVGPEHVLATVMANLISHPLHNGQSIEKIYTSYYEKLVRPAQHLHTSHFCPFQLRSQTIV